MVLVELVLVATEHLILVELLLMLLLAHFQLL
jgi:hypothetical protein